MTLHLLDTVVSTNDIAARLAKEGAAHGTAVLAKCQTGGRGRMGRSFLSPEGGMYLSVVLRPAEPAAQLMALTPILAAAACDAVEEVTGIRPEVKWTNDLVFQNKKLAGILTEPALAADGHMLYAVAGIGMNCGAAPLDESIREMAINLPVEDVSQLARAVALHWEQAASTAVSEKHRWLEVYRRDCVTLGKRVLVTGSRSFYALAVDVDDDGALLVKKDDGSMERVFSGEVSVRGLYGYI